MTLSSIRRPPFQRSICAYNNKYFSWSRLDIPLEHLSFVAKDGDARRLQLEQLLRDTKR